jgi:hypothetical protein
VSITYEPNLVLGLPGDGDTSWGAQLRQNFEVLSRAMAPTDVSFVSPQFSDANLHHAAATSPRMFSTIQAAVDAHTETGSYVRPTICVYPGEYAENIYITSSVAIIGMTPPQYRTLGGACGATISGAPAIQSPTISIYPPESNNLSVYIANMTLRNAYAAAAGQIAKALILRVVGQTLYGSLANYVGLRDCDIVGQTWGYGNDWQALFLALGWVDMSLRGCHVSGQLYAGGAPTGGSNALFNLTGNNAGAKTCSVSVNQCALANYYSGAYTTPGLFRLDNRATAIVSQSSMLRFTGAYAVLGATGTNAITGVGADLVNGTPATMATYGNLPGIDLAIL